MKHASFLVFLLCVLSASFWYLQRSACHTHNACMSNVFYLTPEVTAMLEGPHYKICRSLNPLTQTHLIAFPLDDKGQPYKDVFAFHKHATPAQKLQFVRAIAEAAESANIVEQGYRIVANSDVQSPYLTQLSPHLQCKTLTKEDLKNRLKNSQIPAFCFHVVSDIKALSSTTIAPYAVRNQKDKRAASAGYKGPHTYAECAISRIAHASDIAKDLMHEDSPHFKSFKDHNPQALFHSIAVSKDTYFSHYELFKKADAQTIQDLFDIIVRTGKHSKSGSFRITSNHGLVAHQDQPVAHFHIVADEPLGVLCFPHDIYFNDLTTDLNIQNHEDAAAERARFPNIKGFLQTMAIDNHLLHMDFAATASIKI